MSADRTDPLPSLLVDWETFYRLARQLAFAINDSGYRPDAIVAIGRGGYVPARVLCDFLDVMNLSSIKVEHYEATRKAAVARIRYPLTADLSGQRVLIVDDVSDTGDTFEVAVRHVREAGKPAEIRTAALHHKVVARMVPDYFAERMTDWRWIIYPWAVIEDLSEFVRRIDPLPGSLDGLAERLEAVHGIRVPEETLMDVARILGLPYS